MKQSSPRVAVLGTLAGFHQGAVAFDLKAPVDRVVQVKPDLLCLGLDPDQWEQRRFGKLTPENRLAPSPEAANYGWRHDLANLLYAAIDRLDISSGLQQKMVHLQELLKMLSGSPNAIQLLKYWW